MNFALRARRGTALGLALAVAAVGLTFAPLSVSTADAASNSTNAAKILTSINKVRTNNGQAKLKTNGYIAAFAADYAAKYAKAGTTTGITSSKPIPVDPSTGQLPDGGPLSGYVYGTVSESAKIAKLSSLYKARAEIKQYNYGSISVVKKGNYYYATLALFQYEATPENLMTQYTPTISGSVRLGQTLKASVKTSPTAGAYSYQWKAGDEVISTGSSVKLTDAALVGKKISVTVTATRSGYTTVVKTSKASTVAKGNISVKSVKVSGKRTYGSTLTTPTPTWSSVATYTYQWLRNGKAISGATAQSYKQAYADKGKKIDVKVKASAPGYNSVTKASKTATKTK